MACTGLGDATAIATLDFQRGPRPSGHAWPRALRSAPDSRGRGGCGAGTVTALARGLAGMCQAGRWERCAGQARGRRPASLPAAIWGAGQRVPRRILRETVELSPGSTSWRHGDLRPLLRHEYPDRGVIRSDRSTTCAPDGILAKDRRPSSCLRPSRSSLRRSCPCRCTS